MDGKSVRVYTDRKCDCQVPCVYKYIQGSVYNCVCDGVHVLNLWEYIQHM